MKMWRVLQAVGAPMDLVFFAFEGCRALLQSADRTVAKWLKKHPHASSAVPQQQQPSQPAAALSPEIQQLVRGLKHILAHDLSSTPPPGVSLQSELQVALAALPKLHPDVPFDYGYEHVARLYLGALLDYAPRWHAVVVERLAEWFGDRLPHRGKHQALCLRALI